MKAACALEVLKEFVDGLESSAGERLDEGSDQHLDVVAALHVALMALERAARRELSPPPENAGKPWSEMEDQQLVQAFEADQSIAALARAHKRTHGAIRARLIHLGKIAP